MPNTKLQVQSSRKKSGKEYMKYVVVIPSEIVEQLQWTKGDLLIPSVDGKMLRIKRVH